MKHLPVTTADALEFEAHKPLELVDFAVRSIRNDMTTELEAWMSDLIEKIDVREANDTAEARALLRRGKLLMSKVYFLGTLDTVPLIIIPGLPESEQAYGWTEGSGPDVSITIDSRPSDLVTADHIASTLLHELCHAFIRRYSCRNKLCGEDVCMGSRTTQHGTGGHGLSWNLLAFGVEEAAKRHMNCGYCTIALKRAFGSANEVDFVAEYGELFAEKYPG